ncbi:MAG TPA: glycoside hydrolase domain-containing protein [Streptosporangiaceae bacterium]
MNFRFNAAVLVGLGSILTAPLLSNASALSATSSTKWRSVTYSGVSLKVPAAWPVINFAKHPTACPRLDVHAVYLGRPGPNPLCPAGLVGKTEAVMIGPLAKVSAKTGDRSSKHIGAKARKPAKAHQKPARIMIKTRSSASRTLTTVVARARVQVAISYGIDRSLAQTIQSSIQVTSTTPAVERVTKTRHGTRASRAADTGRTANTGRSAKASHNTAAKHAAFQASAKTPQGLFVGSGFDSCAAPSSGAMTKWLASPFRSVGIYIGGANRACAQANLTSSWLTGIVKQGWRYFPIYPGLQSSCVLAPGDASINTSQASQEGKAAADDAATQAANLGIVKGTPLIYDMEAYGPSCNSQVTTFLSAWDAELQALGFGSGVYESFTNIGALISASGSITEPDVIYYADWDGVASTNSSYMPAHMWTSHQRIHQYLGNHLATYGGVSIDIDTDKLDVNLGGAPVTPNPPAISNRPRISIAINANGTAEWFAKSAANTLIHSWQAPVGSLTWSAMHTLGRSPSTIASNPSVVPEADGGLTIFAASGSGQIVHAWQQAGFPNDWEWGKPLPALPESMRAGTDPAAVLLPIGPDEVLATGTDGRVLVTRQRQPNNNGHWTKWQSIGGSCASSPAPFVDAGRAARVFCVTTAGKAAMTSWNGASWTKWSTVGKSPANLAGVPSAVVNGQGQTELFATTAKGGLAEAWAKGGAWTWTTPLAGKKVTGSPAAAVWPTGWAVVYASGPKGQPGYIRQQGTAGSSGWSGWTAISGVPGGKMKGSPAGWLNSAGAPSVAAVDNNGKLAVSSNTGNGWSSWNEVGSGF